MRILLVKGDQDFAALSFREQFNGTQVSHIMDNLEGCQELMSENEVYLSVIDGGEMCGNVISMVRDDIQDHDGKKETDFWLEDETVVW